MQEKNGTIEELFKEFGLDCDTMEVGVPYDVHESDIEIEAFDEKLNKKVFAKVKNAIKKPIQSSFRIKLKNRKDFEEPMAGDHFIAITHHNTGKIDYTFVKDLINGMNVITEDGEDEIENIESLPEDYVYDIETEIGNYFTNGILSHNTMMSHAIVTCVTPDTMLEVYEENELTAMMSMENLFKKVGFNYKDMTPWEFYDISDRKLFTASYNEKENKIEKKLIQGIVYKGIHPIFEVRTKSGDVILKGSPNHKVFDCATNKYKELKDTKCVTVLNRQQQPIDCVVVNTGREEPIVDISVEGNENYFSNGILSHNTGGYALRYAASTLNRVKKVCDLKDGTGKMIGIQMNVRNYKNKTGIPFRENDMWLYFDRGFDAEGEYIDLVKELQTDPRITALCKIGGAYWKSDKWGWSYKSKDSFISDFVHNEACKDMWEEMKNVIDEVLSGAIESDKETGDPEQMAEQNETYMDSAEARAEINSYKEVEQATQDSIVKKEDGLVTESETPEVTLSEVD